MQKERVSLHRRYRCGKKLKKKIKKAGKRFYRNVKRKMQSYPQNVKMEMLGLFVLFCAIIIGITVRCQNEKKTKEEPGLIQLLQDKKNRELDDEIGTPPASEMEITEERDIERKVSLALPDNYEERYPEEHPQKYTEQEIEERLERLGTQDARFLTILQNKEAYPNALLNNLCVNPNMIDFAEEYLQSYDTTNSTLEAQELEALPLFIQWDKRWGYAAYGNDVIGLSGCGPTCLSMVVVGLTKNEAATPDQLAAYAMEYGYYESGAGTKWSFMSEGAYAYGVTGSWIPLQKETIYEELQAGHPIICAMHTGDFTAEGHYIVIAGKENDMLRIYDPNSMERSTKLWSYETIEPQISNLWSFKLTEE